MGLKGLRLACCKQGFKFQGFKFKGFNVSF